jgi:hypothetical protein
VKRLTNGSDGSPIWITAFEVVIESGRRLAAAGVGRHAGKIEGIANEPGDFVKRCSYANSRQAWPWQAEAAD